MKLRLTFLLPLILASCSDLTPKDQEETVSAPPTRKSPPAAPTPSPAPAPAPAAAPAQKSQASVPGPENPLGFLDPDTTGELLTDAKKKTVTSANSQVAPPPEIEGDGAIDVDPPALPEIKE